MNTDNNIMPQSLQEDDRQDLWNTYVKGGDEALKEMQENNSTHLKLDFLRTIKENLMAVGTARSEMASQILLHFIRARGDDAIQFFHLRTLNNKIKFEYGLEVLALAQDMGCYKHRDAHIEFDNLCRGCTLIYDDSDDAPVVAGSAIDDAWVKESYLPRFKQNVDTAMASAGIVSEDDPTDERVIVLTAISEFENQIAKLSEELSKLRDRLFVIYRRSQDDDA
jgi:hypothetical protein